MGRAIPETKTLTLDSYFIKPGKAIEVQVNVRTKGWRIRIQW